jgi:hypothetical protein
LLAFNRLGSGLKSDRAGQKTNADPILMQVPWRAWLRSSRVAILMQAIT